MKLNMAGVADLRWLRFDAKGDQALRLSITPAGGILTITTIPPNPQPAPPPSPPLQDGPILPGRIVIQDQSGLAKPTLRATVYLPLEISEAGFNFVADLADGKYSHYGPNPPSLPIMGNGVEVIEGVSRAKETVRVDVNGNVNPWTRVPFVAYPQELQDLILQALPEMKEYVQRAVGLICWRYGLDVPPDVVRGVFLYWSAGGELKAVSLRREEHLQIRRMSIRVNAETKSQIQELSDSDKVEPLSHELLREAIGASETAPRSAFLIAVAALEAGIKSHIAKAVPEAEWLLDTGPSPPVHKMLRQYIPLLHQGRSEDVSFWPKFNGSIKDVEDLMSYRNTLAHTGKMPKMKKSMRKYVQAISDILYGLDVLAGNEWAKERVHHEIKRELRWPGHDKQHMEFGEVAIVED